MKLRRWFSSYAIFVALALECLILSATTDTFFTSTNLLNVLRQNAFTAILAAGSTFVILTAGIDLSVGSVVGLTGVTCAGVLVHGGGLTLAVAAALGVGLLVGVINGAVVTWLRIPSFITTLAMMLVVRGAAYKVTDARTISGLPESFGVLSGGTTAAAIMLGVFVLSWFVLMRTAFGRHVYAVGGNEEAAWLSGVRVPRVHRAVYAICGLSAGLAGVLVASRLNAGYPRAGEYYELDAIAAVVVGGTSLFGGRGSIWGALAGAFFIGILNNGLNLFQVSTYDQLMVKGAVLLAAASLDRWRT
ncbi:MAG TPA: ABC transporter permease [Vicinamibacterales bacterium]|jgi:ribose/xylose/arabinose/galactoside ABC-type transport system permease subunit|nr:ABC transporter permease [Vicinamibacterales bacterium]